MNPYPLVLLANEPGFYRSLLASELPILRPDLRIMAIEPNDLDAVLLSLHPNVLICSRMLAPGHAPDIAILILHVTDVDASLSSREGTIVNPRLSEILAAIDRAVSAGNSETAAAHQTE